jgi:hypothetical protein
MTQLHGIRWLIFKNSVPTSQKTNCISITKINQSVLFREIITVYSENPTIHINVNWAKC